jgi:oxygen-independent coproporphyrinogen-3 oxidase
MDKQRTTVQINLSSFEFGKTGVEDRKDYIKTLENEIDSAADFAEDHQVSIVHFTGENTLRYPNDVLTGLVRKLKAVIPFSKHVEMTVDVLPGSAAYADLLAFRSFGIERVSLDMRTFVQSELDALGRTYAIRSMEVFMRMVQTKLVFFNYDITVAYGLPDQTPETLAYSIEQAIRFMPMHLTLQPSDNPDTDLMHSMYRQAVNVITQTSITPYTPLHFARPGYESWLIKTRYAAQPRLGFGAGAVSKIEGMITYNTADPAAYIQAGGDPETMIVKVEPITEENILADSLLNGLFTLRICDLTPLTLPLRERVENLRERGLVITKDESAILTDAGKADWPAVEAALTH